MCGIRLNYKKIKENEIPKLGYKDKYIYNTNTLKDLKRRKDDHLNKITNNTDKV